MNFKKYHVSRNLFIQKLTGVTINSLGVVVSDANYDTYIAEVSDGETYTVSNVTGTQVFGFFTTKPTLGTITYNSSRTIFSTSSQTLTVPTGENIKYIGVRYNTSVSDAMLNTGSQPLPYEPYSSEVWHNTPHYIMGTSTDTLTTLPAVIYANDTTATVGLKGNMEQSSQPSPTTPIQPSECGERTGNLFELSDNSATENVLKTLVDFGEDVTFDIITCSCVFENLEAEGTYGAFFDYLMNDGTHQYVSLSAMLNVNDDSRISANVKVNGNYYNIKQNITFRKIQVYLSATGYNKFKSGNIKWAFYNSDKKDYEPYGYKIPISSANTTTPVYLGEVETTRKIKKYEFTGSETWNVGSENFYCFVPETSGDGVPYSSVICSHCSGSTINNTGKAVFVKKSEFPNITTGAELKQYCLEQYAAGTPVTVWYVLATPTTGIVNEPLRKIGDYADEVSGISIPTIAGANTLSVDTTLQPSEVTATYKGWHPVTDVHERDNGAWTE